MDFVSKIPTTYEDIEAQMKEIQSKKKEIKTSVRKKEQIGLGKTGFYDQDIYDGTNNKYDGYVTSIATKNKIKDEEFEPTSFSSKRLRYNTPASLLNNVAQSEKEFDPFPDSRRPTIADREDKYRQKRLKMISPKLVDPFVDDGKTPDMGSRTHTEIMREQLLKNKEIELRKKIVVTAKDETLKINSDKKPASMKRRRWDHTKYDAPPIKKAFKTVATPTSRDNDNVIPATVRWDKPPGNGATPCQFTRICKETPGHKTLGSVTPVCENLAENILPSQRNRWDKTPKTDRGTTPRHSSGWAKTPGTNCVDGNLFSQCDEWSKYEIVAKIGQGTFGEVFKAIDKKNCKKCVAMKKILMDNEKEGFPITALREIKILKLLKHKNVVNFIEICGTKATQYNRKGSTFYLVFEFCEHDLAGLLLNFNVKFNLGDIKNVMKQLLNGLYYIHCNKILHRDIKPANVLITKNGILKLADFGLARAYSANENKRVNKYTNRVVTLWYRPPELLLGDRNYGPPVDLWGAGCIMAEMWIRSPIMKGKTEQEQLTLISHLCGTITTEIWPGVKNLELFNKMELPKGQKRKVKERLKPYVKDAYACDLLDKLLILDPSKRYDSDSALNHDFFWTDPMPCDLSKMLAQHTHSMFEYLAPPRQPGHMRHPQHHVPGGPTKPSSSITEDGYQDRIF